MSDLISRKKLQMQLNCVDRLQITVGGIVTEVIPRWNVNKIIENLPSAERVGKWIKQHGYYDGDTYYECSECGEEFCFLDGCTPEDNLHFYCPNCGADMRGET